MIRQVRPRYLAIQIDTDASFEEDDVKDVVWNTVFQLFGEYGASKAGLFLINYDKQKKQAVLRCSHKALPIVHSSVVSITKIKGKPTALHVLKISGTLKALAKSVTSNG
jgi:RNase P/RNase MRP subunit POP5